MVILNTNLFLMDEKLFGSTTAMQLWLSLNNLQKTSGFGG